MRTLLFLLALTGIAYAQVDFDNPTPITKPPQEQIVYDKLWMSGFMANAPTPTQPATITAIFLPYDGAGHVDNSVEPKTVKIEDVWTMANATPDNEKQIIGQVLYQMQSMTNNGKVALALQAVLMALKSIGGL